MDTKGETVQQSVTHLHGCFYFDESELQVPSDTTRSFLEEAGGRQKRWMHGTISSWRIKDENGYDEFLKILWRLSEKRRAHFMQLQKYRREE